MQFQLPQNLLKQVVAYDPVLKPIYQRIEQAKKPSKVSSAPRLTLGVIDCLLPTDLVSSEVQTGLTTDMNFTENVERCIQIDNDKCVATIIYDKSVWYAWWFVKHSYLLNNVESAIQHNYVYGFSVAFKNTPASVEKHDTMDFTMGWKQDSDHRSHYFSEYAIRAEVKTGKSKFILKTITVTEEMICSGVNLIPLREKMSSYNKSMRNKRDAMHRWVRTFQDTISTWSDEPLFNRMQEAGDIRKCVFGAETVKNAKPDISFVDLLLIDCMPRRHYMSDEINSKISTILSTPYFRKEANKVFDQTLKIYSDEETQKRAQVQRPVFLFKHKVDIITDFMRLFEDATLDHYQQIWDMADHISGIRVPSFSGVTEWLRTNMPIASYIQIIAKKIEDQPEILDPNNLHWRTGTAFANLHDLNDTISMLDQVYKAQHGYGSENKLILNRPSRWRINEFHDYLQAECFKISTPNEKLPQDFFPEPFRLEKDGQRWSFFQPCDVHQLGSWGKAVRNCVGSADSYRKGIKSKTHFIFLVMLNNEPRYTVQAKLRNGELNIEQIADVCNKPLTSEQRQSYADVFGEVIKQMSNELPEYNEFPEDLMLTAN